MRSAPSVLVLVLAVGLLDVCIGSRLDADAALAQPVQPRLVVFESFNDPG
jgi:hypothetical protein